MNLFDSIALPLKIWQATGLSPFKAGTYSSIKIRRFRSVFIPVVCLIFLYKSNVDINRFELNRESFPRLLKSMVDNVSQLSIFIRIITIFMESLWQSDKQKRFLRDIMTIDEQFEHNMNIDVQYKEQKRRHNQRLFWWISFFVVIGLGSQWIRFLFYQNNSTHSLFNRAVKCFGLIIVLRFYQYSTFVDMISWRYRLINQDINEYYGEAGSWVFQTVRPENPRQIAELCKRLHVMQMIYRSIGRASKRVNELFPVSLSLCIFADFCFFFLYAHSGIKSFFLSEIPMLTILILCSAAKCGYNLLAMGSVCQEASEQVHIWK